MLADVFDFQKQQIEQRCARENCQYMRPSKGYCQATSDMAAKTDDNFLPKHRQPTEIGRRNAFSLQQGQFTFKSFLFSLRQWDLPVTKEAKDRVVNERQLNRHQTAPWTPVEGRRIQKSTHQTDIADFVTTRKQAHNKESFDSSRVYFQYMFTELNLKE